MQHKLVIIWALIMLVQPLFAQQPTIQDCLGAIPVCEPVYHESQSPSGIGNYTQEIASGQTCNFNETNSIWYIFTAASNGQLGFLITPNDINDDYDWVLFNLTNASCQSIFNNNSLVVSCNAAGGGTCNGLTGATGASSSNNQGAGCSGGNSAFNALVPMQAGQTFALLVNNWTGSPNGFTIDFGLSTGLGIFDQQPPRIENVVVQPRRCGENAVRLRFTENIRCNSLSSSAFTLAGPGGPYTLTATSTACQQQAAATREINLTISPPIQQLGDYTLTINPLQSSHLLDQCSNQLADTSLVLQVNQPLVLQPNLGPDLSLGCPGDSLTLSTAITDAQYLWSDGSTGRQLVVSSPGVYRLTVTNACGQGVDSLTVSQPLDLPVVDLGSDQQLCPGQTLVLGGNSQQGVDYLWNDGITTASRTLSGSGGLFWLTATNVCGTDSDSLLVTYIPPIDTNLPTNWTGCADEELLLDLSHPFGQYSWDDGSQQPQRLVTSDGSYRATVTTPCEQQTFELDAIFLQPLQLSLGNDTTLCTGDSLLLDASLPNADLYQPVYDWQHGEQTARIVLREAGLYQLRLSTRCQLLTDSIRVDYLDRVNPSLGRDTFLCEGERLLLDISSPVAADVIWEDGSRLPLRSIEQPGTYWVQVFTACESQGDSLLVHPCENCPVYTPTAFSPNRDGVNDLWMPYSDCELSDFSLKVFDRWGGQLYASTEPEKGWDGRRQGEDAPAGVYVFVLDYSVIENDRRRTATATGSFQLLR